MHKSALSNDTNLHQSQTTKKRQKVQLRRKAPARKKGDSNGQVDPSNLFVPPRRAKAENHWKQISIPDTYPRIESVKFQKISKVRFAKFMKGVQNMFRNSPFEGVLYSIYEKKGFWNQFRTPSPKVRKPRFLWFGLPELLLRSIPGNVFRDPLLFWC